MILSGLASLEQHRQTVSIKYKGLIQNYRPFLEHGYKNKNIEIIMIEVSDLVNTRINLDILQQKFLTKAILQGDPKFSGSA